MSRLWATITPWKSKRRGGSNNDKHSETTSPLRVVVSASTSEDAASIDAMGSTEEIEVAITPEPQPRSAPRADLSRQKTPRSANTSTRLFVEEEKVEYDEAGPSEQEIGIMLQNLRESKTLEDATESIKALYSLLSGQGTDQRLRATSAETMAQLNGVGAILMALQRWFPFPREEFSTFAIRSLIQICCYYPKAKDNIVNIGGVGTVLAAAEIHFEDTLVTANSVGLLCNLSSDAGTKQDVANEKSIDFVVRAMKRYPNHRFIQRNGCAYLSCIGEIEGMNRTFRRREIDSLLLHTFNSFRERENEIKEILFIHKCKEIQAFAKLGLVVYMSGIKRPSNKQACL